MRIGALLVIALAASLSTSPGHAENPPDEFPERYSHRAQIVRSDPFMPQAKADMDPTEFKGKFLVVFVQSKDLQRPHVNYVLEKAGVRRLGDRWFIMGTNVDMGGNTTPHAGSVRWLVLSDVVEINEYDKLQTIKDIAETIRR